MKTMHLSKILKMLLRTTEEFLVNKYRGSWRDQLFQWRSSNILIPSLSSTRLLRCYQTKMYLSYMQKMLNNIVLYHKASLQESHRRGHLQWRVRFTLVLKWEQLSKGELMEEICRIPKRVIGIVYRCKVKLESIKIVCSTLVRRVDLHLQYTTINQNHPLEISFR